MFLAKYPILNNMTLFVNVRYWSCAGLLIGGYLPTLLECAKCTTDTTAKSNVNAKAIPLNFRLLTSQNHCTSGGFSKTASDLGLTFTNRMWMSGLAYTRELLFRHGGR